MVGSLVFPPSHTQVDWRLFVEGEDAADADAAALLADVFGGDAAEDADEAAAAPACGWPRFEASLQALRDAAGEDAAPVARDEAERFAALVRILVAPRTPGHPKSTSWEVVPWFSPTRPRRLAVHFTNSTSTGGNSLYNDLVLEIRVPPALTALNLGANLRSPYKIAAGGSSGGGVSIDRINESFVRLTVPRPPSYGVIDIVGNRSMSNAG